IGSSGAHVHESQTSSSFPLSFVLRTLRFLEAQRTGEREMGFVEYVTSLGTNPYFSAGAGLFGIATGVALLRQGWKVAGVLARQRYLVSLEMSSKDRSYYWTLQWLRLYIDEETSFLVI